MRNKIKYLLCLVVVFSNTSFAFKMTPIEVYVDSAGVGKTRTIKLINNEKIEIPIEVKIYKRSMDIKGKEIRTATKDLIIFPSQLILKPGERRNVRVTWIGASNISSEKSYRIHVRQLPVDVAKKKKKYKNPKMNLNIIFSYMGSLYVQPEKEAIKPKLIVTKLKRTKGNKVKITLENQGTEHAILANFDIFLRGKGLSGNKRLERMLHKKDIPEKNLSVNMLAKSSRELTYTLPPKTITKNITLVFKKKIK